MDDLPEDVEDALIKDELPTYELDDDEPIFTIRQLNEHTYRVQGERIERAAKMTYWEYEEAVNRFQKILETLGITDALREAGVEVGDTVFIGRHELEWSD
jgi:GTP-binding protein